MGPVYYSFYNIQAHFFGYYKNLYDTKSELKLQNIFILV